MHATKLLIIEDDADLLALLAHHPGVADYDTRAVSTLKLAMDAVEGGVFDVALVDLGLGSESGLDVMRAIKKRSPETEIVVMSGNSSLAAAIASYELKAFAFVPKPFDVEHVLSTVRRAVEHRRMIVANTRMAWEQGLINQIGEALRQLLAPEQLVEQVLRQLTKSMGVEFSAARLRNPDTGIYDFRRVSVPSDLHDVWLLAEPHIPRPSDRVLETGEPLRITDLHETISPEHRASVPLRAAVIVPMFIGPDLIGSLSIGSAQPNRFGAEDQRLLGTIANQVAVAVQNARLHAYIRAGKQEWEATFDAIGDPIAVFDRRGRLLRGNTGLGVLLQRPVTALRGLSCDEVGLCAVPFPDCAVGHASGSACIHEEVTRGDQIFSVTSCPVHDISDGGAIVQIAKDVTPEIQSARRMRQMSDELAATNARLLATVDRLKTTQAQLLSTLR